MKIGVWKVAMAAPDDTSELDAMIRSGDIDPASIVACVGKTEGNGGANDFTRGFATLAYSRLLSPYLRCPIEEVGDRIAFVWSGGTEGVLSPHATFFTRENDEGTSDGKSRLALGVAITRNVAPEEVGRMAQVELVKDAVSAAMMDADINDACDVHYVQVKGPLLTSATIADADVRGTGVITRDPNGSKKFARGAMALGVAAALGEIDLETLLPDQIATDMSLYSSVASASAGGELTKCEILLFGNSPTASSAFRIGHDALVDALDAGAVDRATENASGQMPAKVAAVFAKAEAPINGILRGRRTTMLSDADINYERHARAAVGAVIASRTHDSAIFLSGGTEHQCAAGEAPIAIIVSVEDV